MTVRLKRNDVKDYGGKGGAGERGGAGKEREGTEIRSGVEDDEEEEEKEEKRIMMRKRWSKVVRGILPMSLFHPIHSKL